MNIRSKVKAGGSQLHHNETLGKDERKSRGLKVKTRLKAGKKAVAL